MVIEKHMDVVVNPGSAEEIMLCQCGSIDGNRTTVYCPLHKGGGPLSHETIKITNKFSALYHPLQQAWHFRMMEAAQYFGSWTKCLSRQIGAVIVRDKTILSTGYNGPPRGVPECNTPERRDQIVKSFYNTPSDRNLAERLHTEWGTKCPRQILGYKSGEGLHLCIAGHAEANAVANAAREGVRITEAAMYCYCGVPCQECAKMIIGAGLTQVFHLQTPTDYDLNSRWMLMAAGVSLIPIAVEEIEKNRLLRSGV